jgi:hypothetical protein
MMPEETVKIFNPKLVLSLCDSMIEIQSNLKNKSLKKKQRNNLLNRYSSLLNLVEKEFRKAKKDSPNSQFFKEPYLSLLKSINTILSSRCGNPKAEIAMCQNILRLGIRLSDNILTTKEKSRMNEEYVALVENLMIEMSKPIKPLFFIIISDDNLMFYNNSILTEIEEMVKEMRIPLTGEYLNEIKEEAMSIIHHFFSQQEKMVYLQSLYQDIKGTRDSEGIIEKQMRGELEFLYAYLIARKKTIENKLKKFSNDWKTKIQLQDDLSEKQKQIELVEHENNFLDRIIEQSEIFKGKNLTEEEVNYFKQERENLRIELRYGLFKETKFEEWYPKEIGRYTRVNETFKMITNHKNELLKTKVLSNDDYANYEKTDKIKKKIMKNPMEKDNRTIIKMNYDEQIRTLIDLQKNQEEMRNAIKKKNPIHIKAKGMLDKQLRVLQDLQNNDEDFKKLLKRKERGESVEGLIKKNRSRKEILEKENRERSEKAIRWGRSTEGKTYLNKMEMILRLNPKASVASRERRVLAHKLIVLRKDIERREDEYKKLLVKKKEGEFVDDLINQNRFTVEKLLQNKKDWEKAWEKLANIKRKKKEA